MSSRITEEALIYLKFLARANNKQLEAVLCQANASHLAAVFEVLLNYQLGNIKQEERFDRRKDLLRNLTDKSVKLERKRLILCKSAQYRRVVQDLIKLWLNL